MQAYLIYNPKAGRRRERRVAQVAAVVKLLEGHGYEIQAAATRSRGSAGEQVRQAIASGAEIVFAAGGDGTIHDVLQGIAGTSAALAVIPMGSANALCRELRIPLNPIAAARRYRNATLQAFHLSVCECAGSRRYFMALAGAGPDGALMYQTLTAERRLWGRWSYAWHALWLLLRGAFKPFEVRYRVAGSGKWETATAVSAMAIRVGSLGGIFPGIARGASLRVSKLRLVLVSAPAALGLPLWFFLNWLGLEKWNPLLTVHWVSECECSAPSQRVHVQADGEWLGNLPMRMQMLSTKISVLVPAEPQ